MDLTPLLPFEPILCTVPPEGANWAAQIKWDGVRMLHYYDGSESRLFNRKRNERTAQYPELLDTRAFCRARSVVLDGEIVAFDASKPSFHEVMRRDSLKQASRIKLAVDLVPVAYMIFDVLFHDGVWVTEQTLEERQRLLESIVMPSGRVQIVRNFDEGEALFGLMKQRHMEGVVYKDMTSRYAIGGKDGRWRKRKVTSDLVAVVGGVTLRDRIVNSLLLGLYRGDDLIYIGHAGGGKLTQSDWAAITERTMRMTLADKPFRNEPDRSREAVWIKPEMTVKVEYMEFTPGGTMRQPVLQSVALTAPRECTVEQIDASAYAATPFRQH